MINLSTKVITFTFVVLLLGSYVSNLNIVNTLYLLISIVITSKLRLVVKK